MKRLILFLATPLLLLLLAVGCCDCRKQAKNHKPLVGTNWQLVQLMAHDINAEEDSYMLLFHDNGTASGVGDCNRLTATYSMTTSRDLTLSNIGATRRMCPNHELEAEYFAMLERVTHYEMDGDMMLLLSNGELVAIMQAK